MGPLHKAGGGLRALGLAGAQHREHAGHREHVGHREHAGHREHGRGRVGNTCRIWAQGTHGATCHGEHMQDMGTGAYGNEGRRDTWGHAGHINMYETVLMRGQRDGQGGGARRWASSLCIEPNVDL